jgi:general secretion pathway protein D
VASSTKFEDRIKQIITQLDRPVAQVLIKVLIAEVSHDNSNDLGIDWSVLNTRPSGNGEVFSQSVGTAANASAAGLASAGTGGLVVNVLESNINATLIALAQENRLDVLSRPYILATDNQIASITVGQEVPFITNSQITDTGQTLNSIQYQDIGIILDVTPHINPDGLVTLDVSPQISQLTSQTIPITTGVNAPVFDLRSADSRVSIKDGQTIVIGGMMQDTKTTTTRKIPLLGDIPIIGQLFRQDTLDKKKTELLIFLTPHVAMQPDRLLSMSQEEVSKGTVLTTQAVDPGTYQEHMKAMQLGGTSTYPPSNSGFISSPLYGPAPGSGAAPESGTAPGSGVWPGNPPAGGTTPGVTPAPGAGDVSQPPMAPPAPAGSSATQGSAP